MKTLLMSDTSTPRGRRARGRAGVRAGGSAGRRAHEKPSSRPRARPRRPGPLAPSPRAARRGGGPLCAWADHGPGRRRGPVELASRTGRLRVRTALCHLLRRDTLPRPRPHRRQLLSGASPRRGRPTAGEDVRGAEAPASQVSRGRPHVGGGGSLVTPRRPRPSLHPVPADTAPPPKWASARRGPGAKRPAPTRRGRCGVTEAALCASGETRTS